MIVIFMDHYVLQEIEDAMVQANAILEKRKVSNGIVLV